MRKGIIGGIVAAGLVIGGVAGCTAASPDAAPTVTKTVTVATPAPKATLLPASSDTSAPAVCGEFSAYFTIEANAVQDAAAGRITTAEEASLLTAIRTPMTMVGSDDAGVQAAASQVSQAVSTDAPAASGLPFDPASTTYTAARDAMSTACDAAGSRITISSSTGG